MAMTEQERKDKQRARDEARAELRDEWIPFIAYEEILDEDFIGKLASMGYECCVGPVHDKDENPDGLPKKKHRHCLTKFRGKKYIETYYAELGVVFGTVTIDGHISVRGIPYPQKLKTTPAAVVRYMLHLDNPEKHRYEDLPIGLCGFEPLNLLYNNGDIAHQLDDIFTIIEVNEFEYPRQLVSFLKWKGRRDLLLLYYTSKSYLINSFLNGNHRELEAIRKQSEAAEAAERVVTTTTDMPSRVPRNYPKKKS